MKKLIHVAMMVLLMVGYSCSKDDDSGNLPPTEVTNIQTEVLSGTTVKVSWDAATSPNNDAITYDVIVNENVIATNTPEVFVEFDTARFLFSAESRTNIAKGATLDLLVKIRTFNGTNFINDIEVKRSVFVNRAPTIFEFENIRFNTFDFSTVDISWFPASDEDGDILSYDVFLNDIVIVNNYVIGSNSQTGFVSYNESFAELVDSDMVFRIVANDRAGGINEISKTINLTATDVDLGIVTLPYENEFDVLIQGTEADNQVRYIFEVTEETGYFINSNINARAELLNSNGNYIDSGSFMTGFSLQPGSYELIYTSYQYGNVEKEDIVGTTSISLKNPKDSDVDLGNLAVPSRQSFDFDATQELDREIGYTFTITEETSYSIDIINENYDDFINLFDQDGNSINSIDTGALTGTLLPGSYYVVADSYFSSSTGQGTLIIDLLGKE